MQKKVNEATRRKTAELITLKGAAHGDAVIETNESVVNDSNFVDKTLDIRSNSY